MIYRTYYLLTKYIKLSMYIANSKTELNKQLSLKETCVCILIKTNVQNMK